MIAIAAAVIILLIGGITGSTLLIERRQQSEREKELEAQGEKLNASLWTNENTVYLNSELYGFDHRVETFLFIGTDASGSGNDDPEDYHGPMADFLLLMVLDHTNNSIGYIQIDRNTVTDVNELDSAGNVINTRELQICTAHWYGRSPEMCAENTVVAVKKYLGELENIDGYYVINMKDIGTLNHAVGGVEVTIDDDLDSVDPELSKGSTLVLDDAQAEKFLRARMNVGQERNAERMVRQHQYMSSFFSKVRTKTMENPKFGLELWNMLKEIAVTNMNGNDFSRIAQKLLKGENKGIHTIQGETVMGYILEDGVEHEEFYPDESSKCEEMVEMFSLISLEEPEDDDDAEYYDEDLDDEESEYDEDDDEYYEDDEDYEDDDEYYEDDFDEDSEEDIGEDET